MKTAIVILNWNGKELLETFLPSIEKYSSEKATIYVADNASSDDSITFIKKNYPSIQIVKNRCNGGYAKGYNDALQAIDADIYCLMNSDIEVTKNWLSSIINVFKKNQNVAIIQPKILDYHKKDTFEYAGAAGGFIDFLGYPYCRGRVFNSIEKDTHQYDDITEIFWASGACFFIRSQIFHQLAGFDEDYFAHQEEIDLCWRVNNLGYKIMYVGNSAVYHVGGATLKETNPHKTFLNFRNSLLNVVKNVPNKWLLIVVISRLILDGIAGIKFIVELRPIHTLAILKAHLSFYKNLRKFLKKRHSVQKKLQYFSHISVVWQYFAMRREKFEDLD